MIRVFIIYCSYLLLQGLTMIVHQQAVQAYEPSPSFTSCSCCLKFKKRRCGLAVANDMAMGIHVAHDSHVIEIQIQQQLCACSLS